MGLDIKTERGQKSKEYETKAYRKIEDEYGGSVVETPKDKNSKVDGFLVKNGEILGVCETKCRQLSKHELNDFGTWLITNQKIVDGKLIANKLSVPFYGILYLIPNDFVFIWEIMDSSGNKNFDYEVKETKTQKTINGGTVKRRNAFLPVDNIKHKIK